jgi:hypothetical protein
VWHPVRKNRIFWYISHEMDPFIKTHPPLAALNPLMGRNGFIFGWEFFMVTMVIFEERNKFDDSIRRGTIPVSGSRPWSDLQFEDYLWVHHSFLDGQIGSGDLVRQLSCQVRLTRVSPLRSTTDHKIIIIDHRS